jgi:hypothetical protein
MNGLNDFSINIVRELINGSDAKPIIIGGNKNGK